MLIEEEEPKGVKDINPDTLDAVFEDVLEVDEEVVIFKDTDEDDDVDEIDIAFAANDEGYW